MAPLNCDGHDGKATLPMTWTRLASTCSNSAKKFNLRYRVLDLQRTNSTVLPTESTASTLRRNSILFRILGGIVTDKGNQNREIRKQSRLLKEVKRRIAALTAWVKGNPLQARGNPSINSLLLSIPPTLLELLN